MLAVAFIAGVLSLSPASPAAQDAGTPAAEIVKRVGFDQRLGEPLPLDAAFVDEDGNAIRLGDCFRGRPVVLTFVYFDCPMLCTLVSNGLVRCVRALDLDAGGEFEIVAVSIDPDDTPAEARAKRDAFVADCGAAIRADACHFLTGGAASIEALTYAAGFRYYRDPESGQFAHASGLVVATPEGVVSRCLLGLEFSARDLKLGLVEASAGKIGSLVDQVLLLCFQYDPATGRYGLAIVTILRALAVATVVAIAFFVTRQVRRERRRRLAPGSIPA